jgi:very-short-patch-repair endonuclease
MVGDNERPASQADLDSVQDQLSAVANDPNLTLVVPHAFDYKFVGANGQILPVSNEFELLDQEILDGLMVNKALLNGEGPAYGNAQVGLLAMNERLETWRREVSQWIEEKIFRKVAEWNGFYAEGEGGQQELVYPTIVFDPLRLKDNTGTLQMLVTAQQNGVISAETLVEEFGLNWDQEVERLRFEQGMNFVNSSEIMNTDMNIGFGGVTGEGFGAGSAPGGAPLGGPMGAPMGGGMGELGAMGGEPPAAAGIEAPAPTAPPATAESIHQQYKFASSLMNEIAFNRTSMASLSEREYVSAVDKELNERLAVTGRGIVGEIPEDLEPTQPWDWNPIGEPMNYDAMKLVKQAKVKQKQNIHGYTSLEKKLYQIVMQIGAPLAFYAQYEAGPGKEYILDGAFPQIKLAVEADGEIWHNNPQKIQSDKNRDVSISRQGWTILRFTDKEITKQPKDVAMVIKQAIQRLLGNYGAPSGQQTI